MATRPLTHLCFGLVSALVGSLALAQAPAPKPDLMQETENLADLLTLLNTPITTASKRAEKAIEAPSVVSVITRNQFQAYGWTTINDALYSLPGFGPSQDYDRRTVSSRGLFEGWNNNHILMLVDGIPFNDNLYGSAYTWDNTPVFFIKTLEVVRGPGSALYGSNSTNSATQLRTISAKDLSGTGEAQARLGQNGERIFDMALGHTGEYFSAVGAFSTSRTNGNNYLDYDGSGRTDGGGNLQKFRVLDGRNSQYGWLKMEGEGTLAGLSMQYHHQAWNFQSGHGWLWAIPDVPEQYQEKREIVSISYHTKVGKDWELEGMLRHQRHDIFWDMRYFLRSETLPGGGSEVLDTSASDWFGRAQASWDLPKSSNLLFGVEATRFLYSGDRAHYGINYDFNNYVEAPGEIVPAGPWLEFIKDKPMLNTGFYAQFSSGKLFGDLFKLVLGVRNDRTSFDFTRIYDAGKPTDSKSYSETSPRVALIFSPSDKLAIKAMYGSAFRAPTPSEVAGANTYSLASNIDGLKPETLKTVELAVDWIVNANLNWRTNIFRTKFNDQIAYSLQNANLSTNVYTLTTQGLETELLYGFANWKGYVNFSMAKRVDEEIIDTTIAASPDQLTWEPGHRFKVGVIYTNGQWTASANALYQGKVERRATDFSEAVNPYRPASLDPWLVLNLKVGWAFAPGASVSLVVNNALNTDKNILIKTQAFPFDYKGEERRASLVLRTTF